MKNRFVLMMTVSMLLFTLISAPSWSADPSGDRDSDQDEPFMTDRVLEEDLERMPAFDRDLDFDSDTEDDSEEIRQQLRKDIPELTDELEEADEEDKGH